MKSPRLFVLLAALGVTTALFWPVLFDRVLADRDLITVNYPFRWLAAHIWASGEIPLWNSASACGMPLLADLPVGAFDPLIALFLLPIGVCKAGTLLLWLKFLLAGLAMHRYLRLVGLPSASAFVGGCAFILSGYSIGSWTHLHVVSSLLFLPLALSIPHVGGTPIGRGIASGAVLSFSFLCGAPEQTLFTVLFWMVESRHRPKEILIGLLGFISFSLFQSLPTFEMYLLSDRQGGLNLAEAFSYSLSPYELIGLATPTTFFEPPPGLYPFAAPLHYGTYIGAALLPLIFFFRSAPRRFYWFAMAGFVFALGQYLPGLVPLAEKFPVIASFRYPIKFFFFVPPSLAILAAFGHSGLRCEPMNSRAKSLLYAFLIIAGFVLIGAPPTEGALLHSGVAFFTAAFLIMVTPTRKFLLAGVVIADLLIGAQRTLIFEDGSLDEIPALRQIIPDAWPRVLTDASFNNTAESRHESMLSNTAIPYLVRHPDEHASFRSKVFKDWWIPLMQAGSFEAFGAYDIAYYICGAAEAEGAIASGWINRGRSKNFFLLENPVRQDELRFSGNGTVRWNHSLSGRTDVVIDAKEPGWLYRAENFYPGWKAFLNGDEAEIHSRKGVLGQWLEIPAAGRYEITFLYRPAMFTIGLSASFIAMLVCIAALLRRR